MTQIYNCDGNGEIHLDVLKAICGNTNGKSMLDMGCGFAPQTRQLGFSERTYVDVVKRDLGDENVNFIHCDLFSNKYLKPDFFYYDVSIMLDCIEHFKKESGRYMLYVMGRQSKMQIIFTPLGDYLIEEIETDHPDSHKSGWEPKEFEEMGWHTIVFPNFHKLLNTGAFFAIKNKENNFTEIINELNKKEWAK